ncbi:MAG: diphosphate--fructose-6-phosphate 1-phosphotransferase [Candidatus Moduliflexus flocculans]|nr:diphosphate--fructose-6-phosphate 1-phosphotransferase [Candidatus Moduliflexus flocculans]
MGRGNLIVGQSGGPTSVINASLAGIVRTAAGERRVDRVLGMRYGIEGLMAGNLVDLGKESASTVEGLIRRPSSALGSCRLKLKDEHLPRIFEIIKANDIRCMLLIGGNDTMDTIRRISEYARERGYDFAGVGVPKTVDNDLYGTDHTPGFASAARYTALSVQQAGILARDMRMVDQYVVFQAIGRDAGWLAAAAALARRERGDAPHILVLQERAFDKDAFLGKVESVYKDHGFVSIVCGEGCKHADGTPVSASRIMDKFGNIEFGAMGGTGVALVLHRMIAETFRIPWRIPNHRIPVDVRRRSGGPPGRRGSLSMRQDGRRTGAVRSRRRDGHPGPQARRRHLHDRNDRTFRGGGPGETDSGRVHQRRRNGHHAGVPGVRRAAGRGTPELRKTYPTIPTGPEELS